MLQCFARFSGELARGVRLPSELVDVVRGPGQQSRETVEADLPITVPISLKERPWAQYCDLLTLSEGQTPALQIPARRGLTPPAKTRTRRPVRRLVLIGATASVMKSPACIPAQKTCKRSGLK